MRFLRILATVGSCVAITLAIFATAGCMSLSRAGNAEPAHIIVTAILDVFGILGAWWLIHAHVFESEGSDD